jgi:hypothetical protein
VFELTDASPPREDELRVGTLQPGESIERHALRWPREDMAGVRFTDFDGVSWARMLKTDCLIRVPESDSFADQLKLLRLIHSKRRR